MNDNERLFRDRMDREKRDKEGLSAVLGFWVIALFGGGIVLLLVIILEYLFPNTDWVIYLRDHESVIVLICLVSVFITYQLLKKRDK